MEARFLSAIVMMASLLSLGAGYRTQNFIISAATPELAQEIGEHAERFRRDLAIEWLGGELPPWPQPCPIHAEVSPHLGAGGATSFMFERGQPFGWRMTVQGSRERVLDSVLPHEITHTIFATHFGRPLPRWADEGACTTVEHASEKDKQHRMLYSFLTTGRGIAFNDMFAMTEYPADILPLYSQGYSLARFLIAQGGKPKFVQYVGDGMRMNNWTAATKKHYGFVSLSDLQVTWLDWVRQGCPAVDSRQTLIASQNAAESQQNNPSDTSGTIMLASASSADRADQPDQMRTAAAPREGWYARQSRLTAVSRGQNPSETARITATQSTSADIDRSVTRPQEPGRPGQLLLPSPSPTARQGTPGLVPVPYDAVRDAGREQAMLGRY
jgi:hypothetical protein